MRVLRKAGDNGPPVPVPAKPKLVKQAVRRADILFNQTNDSVAFLQDVLGLTPDGLFGAKETKRFMEEQFGWNGKKPMTGKLFRKLFPAGVFILDATIGVEPAAIAVPGQRAETVLAPAAV